MPRSPKSRGKGSRRGPWREGGAQKNKPGLPAIKVQPAPALFSSWHELEPLPLSKPHRDHPWLFAIYVEWNRADGTCYQALLFRNRPRTVYGIREWFTRAGPGRAELRKLAHRIVVDPAYRASLVSDDPKLADLWQRH
jgi:hypothetical protein